MNRRDFLLAAGAAAAWAGGGRAAAAAGGEPPPEALFYTAGAGGRVTCGLCPRHCELGDGERGRCGVRENRGGRLAALVYGRPVALNVDPIEKKPFYHVLPGSRAFSIATVGCNLACRFCQNWDISQARPEDVPAPYRPPAEVVRQALAAGARTVAYTYNEPTVFYEYMLDCARAAHAAGLGNVVVSNGYIEEAPLRRLAPWLTAMKVDLKAFTQRFYGEVCDGELEPVLRTLRLLRELRVWLEIVVLLVPTLNDSPEEARRLAGWIVRELGPDVPLFFTRFHPAYRLRNLPPTPPAVLAAAGAAARAEGCRFVYAGNMPGTPGETTCCPSCGADVVRRYGFHVLAMDLRDGACPACGRPVPGVWTLP